MEKNHVICDLDGTLSDLTHRRHLVERPPCPHCKGSRLGEQKPGNFILQTCEPCKGTGEDRAWRPSWDTFHRACVDDALKPDVLAVVQALANRPDTLVHIVSGRSASVRAETEWWLDAHGVDYATLTMRPVGNYVKDDELKQHWLLSGIIGPGIGPRDVLCALDDRDRVVEMWRRHGITCLQVARGNF